MIAEDAGLWDVLEAFARRAGRRRAPFSTKAEIADELSEPRSITDPLVEKAIERGYLDEDPRYSGYWRLNDEGQGTVDARVFNP